MFGVTSTGSTVACHVLNFEHYFFVEVTISVSGDAIKSIKEALDEIAKAKAVM
jgi:hypothetical protein